MTHKESIMKFYYIPHEPNCCLWSDPMTDFKYRDRRGRVHTLLVPAGALGCVEDDEELPTDLGDYNNGLSRWAEEITEGCARLRFGDMIVNSMKEKKPLFPA